MRDEAHLRGLERIIYSTTISPRLWNAKPACAGYAGLFLQRPYAPGYARRSPPARACQQAASAAFALLAEPFRTTARRRGEPLGYPGRSPPARAMPDYFFKDHTPPAMQGEARLRGLASRPRQRPLPCSPSPSGRRRAVGVNPSAIQGEARLRGLCRIISSKTIYRCSPRAAQGCAASRGRGHP